MVLGAIGFLGFLFAEVAVLVFFVFLGALIMGALEAFRRRPPASAEASPQSPPLPTEGGSPATSRDASPGASTAGSELPRDVAPTRAKRGPKDRALTLVFGNSRSKYLAEASKLAGSIKGCVVTGEGDAVVYRVPLRVSSTGKIRTAVANRLHLLVGTWKSTQILDEEGHLTSIALLVATAQQEACRRQDQMSPNLPADWLSNQMILRQLGPPWVPVAGVNLYKDALQSLTGQLGWGPGVLATVDLVREPENETDTNAVRVDLKGSKVGYLPAEYAVTYARLMDDLDLESVAMAAYFSPFPSKPGVVLGALWPDRVLTPAPKPGRVWDSYLTRELKSKNRRGWPPKVFRTTDGSGTSRPVNGCGASTAAAACLVLSLAGVMAMGWYR